MRQIVLSRANLIALFVCAEATLLEVSHQQTLWSGIDYVSILAFYFLKSVPTVFVGLGSLCSD